MATNVSGVILFHETVYQKTASGETFISLMKKMGIIPGIKVDSGVVDLMASEGECTTQGKFCNNSIFVLFIYMEIYF